MRQRTRLRRQPRGQQAVGRLDGGLHTVLASCTQSTCLQVLQELAVKSGWRFAIRVKPISSTSCLIDRKQPQSGLLSLSSSVCQHRPLQLWCATPRVRSSTCCHLRHHPHAFDASNRGELSSNTWLPLSTAAAVAAAALVPLLSAPPPAGSSSLVSYPSSALLKQVTICAGCVAIVQDTTGGADIFAAGG